MSALEEKREESFRIEARSSGTCGRRDETGQFLVVFVDFAVVVGKTYLAHTLVALNQTMHRLDRQKAIVHRYVLLTPMDHVRRDDGRQIVDVHLASALLVDVAERRDPVHEREQHLHGIPVLFGQQAARQM